MKEIRTYIDEQLQEGHTLEDIRRHLLKYGHSQEKVDKALHLTMPQLPTFRLLGETWMLIMLLTGIAWLFIGFYSPFDPFVVPFMQSSSISTEDAFQQAKASAEFSLGAATLRMATTPLDADRKFADNFLNCKKSSHVSILAEHYAYEYDIVGPKNDLCEVKSRFVLHPESSWQDVEMVCLYDTSLPLQQSLSNLERCAGPLYDLMVGGF